MVKRTVLSSSGSLMMVKVELPKDFQGDIDRHPEEQLSYLEKGIVEFELSGEKRIIGQGETLYIPSNEIHRVKVIEECVIIDIFTPVRKDLLQ
ncbi:cupin domain-containing protein [Petroclostridium sp. X23]|uniref:cupin domain-containing protein n=1 Tax=Petroclostridium sp. X23 TaxID=3045146 RepID=UPI0024AC8D9B|nr:cupin domain-containing protein [Petroclostridium sp. X23]WHH59231.1 cupin domain-containing protein [Petroclostridium sp. X23]